MINSRTSWQRSNKAVNADAQLRPLLSVAPFLLRRLPLR
jgi:hypothetical protein